MMFCLFYFERYGIVASVYLYDELCWGDRIFPGLGNIARWIGSWINKVSQDDRSEKAALGGAE
jgi:hypothetical protein